VERFEPALEDTALRKLFRPIYADERLPLEPRNLGTIANSVTQGRVTQMERRARAALRIGILVGTLSMALRHPVFYAGVPFRDRESQNAAKVVGLGANM